MPVNDAEGPFDSIESAQDFVTVLVEVVMDTIKTLHHDHHQAVEAGEERRAQAIALAIYKLKVLNSHLCKSRRALNDLRTLRRLILDERVTERIFAM